jgi:pilus assembly protein FimV
VKQFVNDNKLPTALGLLLLLLLLWLLARRSRREVTWDEAVQKMDKASEKQAGKSTVVAPVNDDDMTDAPLSEQEHEQEKSVSELVEQADMFVGYADYVQARSSLEQARSMEPANSLVAYKLLFVLYKQQQTDEFIALVEEVPFETDSFEWAEIKQWGKALAPNHSLFAEQQAEPAKAEDSDTEALTVSETVTESAQAEPDTEVEAEVETQDSNHIEFDLNDFADTEVQTEPEGEASSNKKQADDVDDDLLTFDTNLGLDDKIQTTEDEDNTPLELDITEDDERDETLSFDQNIESDSSEPEDTDALLNEAEFVETNDEEPDLEFDIDDLDEIDEAETKLDLAAAYIDMGDPDGARSILNEVLLEGNDEQKNRAHDLLNSLS